MATKAELKDRTARLVDRLNIHGQQLFDAKELIQAVACLMTRFPIRFFFPRDLRGRIESFLSK